MKIIHIFVIVLLALLAGCGQSHNGSGPHSSEEEAVMPSGVTSLDLPALPNSENNMRQYKKCETAGLGSIGSKAVTSCTVATTTVHYIIDSPTDVFPARFGCHELPPLEVIGTGTGRQIFSSQKLCKDYLSSQRNTFPSNS